MEDIKKSDTLKVGDETLKESINPYFSDIYSPGDTKEPLVIGEEVAKPKIKTGTIHTSTFTATTDNIYTLSIANPDGQIFSLGIDGLEKSFKIGFFNNTQLAYEQLETELQEWLGEEYIVSYVSGTNFSLSRFDKTLITYTDTSLIRRIEIGTWTTGSTLELIIDGTTYNFNYLTYPTIASIFDYLDINLSYSIYVRYDKTSYFLLGRKDGAIPSISFTPSIVTVSTHTEISITNTLSGKNYYVDTLSVPRKITIKATGINGTSDGTYYREEQKCTTKYGTTTGEIVDKIFKTDANNYGNIVGIDRGGFIISWTTNSNNILDYTCETQ